MKKLHKLLLISLALAAVSGIMISIGIAKGGREFLRYKNIDDLERIAESDLGRKVVSLEWKNKTAIEIDVKYRDIHILKSEDENIHLSYSNPSSVQVSDDEGSLKILESGLFRKPNYINIDGIKQLLLFGSIDDSGEYLKLYLPDRQYQQLLVKNDAGSTFLDSGEFDQADFRQSYGDISISNAKFSALSATSHVGDLFVKSCEVAGKMDLKTETSNLDLHDCVADEYVLESDVGSIRFSKLTVNQSFDAESNVGEIEGAFLKNDAKFYFVEAESKIGTCKVDSSFHKGLEKQKEIVPIHLKTKVGDITVRSE